MIEAKYTLTGEVNVATSIEYIQPNLEEGKVTPTKEEQIIKPSEEYNGFSQVTIDPIPNEYIIPSGNLDIEANGDYDVSLKSTVKVNVNSSVNPTLQDKSISVKPNDNIKVIADEGFDGLREVNVVGTIDLENVEITPTKEVQTINRSEDKYIESVTINPIPDNYIEPTGELDIIENGQYDVTDKASVNVNIETGGGGDLSEYFNETITYGDSSLAGWIKAIKKLPAFEFSGTSAANMFANFKGTEIDLSKIDTKNATRLNNMFSGAGNVEELDISHFNIGKVTNVSYMFSSMAKLKRINLSIFETNIIENMANMFSSVGSSAGEDFSLDFSKFYTGKATNMSYMFSSFGNTNSPYVLNISHFDTSNVTNFTYMFTTSNVREIVARNLDVSKSTSFANLCYGANAKRIDFSGISTTTITNMSSIFRNCSKLEYLDIRDFDFTNVTSHSYAFTSVPASCLVIVKDDAARTWITSKFAQLTNIKTVAEL